MIIVKRFRYLILFLLLLIVFAPGLLHAQDIELPDYTGYVNDFAKVIDADTVSRLESLISQIEAETTAEIAVVTIESLQGKVIEDYAIELFSQWGIGKEDQDNGVLLLVAIEDRTLRLEIGYGLEGAITDVESKRILENSVIPQFKEGNYSQGIYAGVEAVAAHIYDEANIESDLALPAVETNTGSSSFPYVFIYCCLPPFILISLIIFLVNLVRRRCPQCRRFFKLKIKETVLKRATFTQSGQKKVERWCTVCDFADQKIVKIPTKTHSSGTWLGGGGSGSSGGGFGGFGGGSSGGGGASGRW